MERLFPTCPTLTYISEVFNEAFSFYPLRVGYTRVSESPTWRKSKDVDELI